MHTRCAFAAGIALVALFASPVLAQDVVTIYSADGLHDGTPNWYQTQFDAFTKATGIKVQYIEAGSGGVVERVAKEATNPQADVIVTLPPFIMKAVADGLIQAYTPAGSDKIAAGHHAGRHLRLDGPRRGVRRRGVDHALDPRDSSGPDRAVAHPDQGRDALSGRFGAVAGACRAR
jgi:ABC-type thiamine transport system substrate-binding protein